MPQTIQRAGQKKVDRKSHIWHKREDGTHKCVLCGGVTDSPTPNDLCSTYEKLTPAERMMARETL